MFTNEGGREAAENERAETASASISFVVCVAKERDHEVTTNAPWKSRGINPQRPAMRDQSTPGSTLLLPIATSSTSCGVGMEGLEMKEG